MNSSTPADLNWFKLLENTNGWPENVALNHQILQGESLTKERNPCVLMLHQATGDMNTFLPEAIELSKLGITCALLEAPYSRKRNTISPRGLVNPENERRIWDQTCEELDEISELLIRLHGCRADKIGFVGLNLGGSVGVYWAGKQSRPLIAVAIAGAIPDLTSFWLESSHPVARSSREQAGIQQRLFKETMQDLDLIVTLPKIQETQVLVQIGKQDDWISAESLEKLRSVIQTSALSSNLHLDFQDDAHDMMAQPTVQSRMGFIRTTLGYP
jgi:dienelactone hydrolase